MDKFYTREFEKYLESIYFKKDKFLPTNNKIEDPQIQIRKIYGTQNFNIYLFYFILSDDGTIKDIFDCGLDFEKYEINQHYNDFLSKDRDDKIKEILNN